MATETERSIYLLVDFNWPKQISKEMAEAAKKLHEELRTSEWISSKLAASGGLGGEQSSSWVFEMANYAALDRLLGDREDPASQAYVNFFSKMVDVQDRVREKVLFI